MNKSMGINSKVDERLRNAIADFSKITADEALSEFLALIDLGCDQAFSFVGNIYECGGRNVGRDYAKARFYYEKSVETVGSVAAYLGLIRLYYYGLGVESDYKKAFEYCCNLSEKTDDPYANFYLGRMYMDGCFVAKDLEKAMHYFKRSWGKGYVFGLTYLGICFQKKGRNVRGWVIRMKAGLSAYRIARKDIGDWRIRQL